MKAPRYILRYLGKGATPPEARKRLADATEIKVVDETLRMALVEASTEALDKFVSAAPAEWAYSAETYVQRPIEPHRITRSEPAAMAPAAKPTAKKPSAKKPAKRPPRKEN